MLNLLALGSVINQQQRTKNQKKTTMNSYLKGLFIPLLILVFSFQFSSSALAENLSFLDQSADTTNAQSEGSSLRAIGFLQQQFTSNTNDDVPNAFSIYRARVGVAGKITDRVSVNIVAGAVEPPDRNPHLVNAFIDYDIDPLLTIRTGQFLVPFGLEGPEVITFNPAIERSIAVRRLNTVRMFRDIGVQASGSTESFNYAVALVNGTGANVTEQINPKDLMGRIGYAPTENLEVGFSGHFGTYLPDGNPENEQSRFRAGTDFSYQAEPLLVRGEFIIREDDLPANNSLNQNGGYLLGAYDLSNNWQALMRFEYHDPNTSVDDNELTSWTAGINYYFVGQTRVSANYEFRNDRNNPNIGDLFTVQLQVAL